MNKQKQKEQLPLRIAKITLMIAVITGIGTIIFGGGVVIMKYYNGEVNNRIAKPVDQETENYYDALEKKCAGDSCCLSSLGTMRKNNYKLAPKNICPDGFQINSLWCIGAYSWCEPIEEDCAKAGEFANPEQLKGKTKHFDNCCSGLKKLSAYGINNNEECEVLIGTPFLTCMPCGNGICETINNFDENKYNCPEDCGDEIDTSNWQTYRNEEFGFEFQYPILGVNNEKVFIKEKNNLIQICVKIYGDNDFCHRLKYYEKPKEETVEDSIKRQILDEDEQAICTIEKGLDSENGFKTYYINCPSVGPSGFAYNHYISDSNYPELFLMYSIGHDTAFDVSKWINSISFF